MANQDSSQYTLRYNEVSGALEAALGNIWSPVSLTNVAPGAAVAGAIGSSGLTQNTARLLGRTTASAGAVEEITVGSGLSLIAGSLTATQVFPQVLQATDVITNTTIVPSAATAIPPTQTITLQKATNAVKISWNGLFTASLGTENIQTEIYRDGVSIKLIAFVKSAAAGSNTLVSFNYLDTPGSVGPFTYQVFGTNQGSGSENVATTGLILEEILS